MPRRSKVITMLPAYIRQEVERRLFENGFRDYEGLAQWVRGQGYEVSDDSLWYFGLNLQQQLAALRLTVGLARGLNDERAVGDANAGLAGTPSPGGRRTPTQRDADLRT